MLPLRLYLTCSFLSLLVVKLTPGTSMNHAVVVDVTGKRLGTAADLQARADAAAKAASTAASATASVAASGLATSHRPRDEALRPVDGGAPGQRSCNRVETLISNSGAGFSKHPQEVVQHVQAHRLADAPYLVLLTLPAFAGIVKLAHWNR